MFKKTYLSLSVSRTWSAYEPVGDPFGGPAYGEKEFLPLIAAGLSIAGGLGAFGAVSTLVGGLMIAGGVMSGLGYITGNKTLSTLGMVASLAGGVTAFFEKGGFSALGGGDAIKATADTSASSVAATAPESFGAAQTSIADNIVGKVNPGVDGIMNANKTAEALTSQSITHGDSFLSSGPVGAGVGFNPNAQVGIHAAKVGTNPQSIIPDGAIDAAGYDAGVANSTLGDGIAPVGAAINPGYSSGAPTAAVSAATKGAESSSALSSMKKWWGDLSSSEKLMAGQGLAGVGQGLLSYMGKEDTKSLNEAKTKESNASASLIDAKATDQNKRIANRDLTKVPDLMLKTKPGNVTGGAYDYAALWQKATTPSNMRTA